MENDRREDWRNSVNDRLVSLTSAQKTTDDELDEIQEKLREIDHILRGYPDEDLEGLIASRDKLATQVLKFNALLMPDIHGHGGVVNDLNEVLQNRTAREKRADHFWKFATAVVVQFLILIGLLVVNWDRIQEYIVLHEHIYQAASIEKDTKKRKALRAHKKRKAVEVPEASNESTEPDPQE